MKPRCSVDGCARPARTKGMCDTCYRRWKRNGHTDYIKPRRGLARRKKTRVPGALFVECGDCRRLVAVVTTRQGVWQAIDAHFPAGWRPAALHQPPPHEPVWFIDDRLDKTYVTCFACGPDTPYPCPYVKENPQ